MTRGRNAEYTKEYNRKVVLRLLREKPVSRAELARLTGLTRAATSLIAAELLEAGVIRELAPEGAGRGRSGIPLTVCPDKYYAVSICLEREACEVGICDFAGTPFVRQKLPPQACTMEEVISRIEQILANCDRKRVLGIGICAPGPLDAERGVILNPTGFDQWHGIEVASRLSEWFSLPAYLENVAMSLAMHQMRMSGNRNFLLLLVEQGIGSGVITNGRPLCVSKHFNCELGHTSIRYDGRQCECGNRGCLELYASMPNLLRGTQFSSWKAVIDALGTAPEAESLLRREAIYLTAGIVNMLNMVEVDTVYLAGDIRYGVSHLTNEIWKELKHRSPLRGKRLLQLLPADAREDVRLVSAADIVFSRFLDV